MAAGGPTIAAPLFAGGGDRGRSIALGSSARTGPAPAPAARHGTAPAALPLGPHVRHALRARPRLARRAGAGAGPLRVGAALASAVVPRRRGGGRGAGGRLWKNPRHG